MANKDSQNKKTNFSFMLLLAIGIALASLIFIYPVYSRYVKAQNERNHLEQLLQEKKVVNAALIKEQYELQHNPKAVEKVARELFEYCREGETIMVYDSTEAQKNIENQ